MNITEAMIEVGARAFAQRWGEDWDRLTDEARRIWRDLFRHSFASALAAAEAHGVVLAVVPDDPHLYMGGSPWEDGFKKCRAAVLAGRVVFAETPAAAIRSRGEAGDA